MEYIKQLIDLKKKRKWWKKVAPKVTQLLILLYV